jgi:hypothetical protein
MGSLIAAGAISISFAASSYSSVAAAKEMPRADLIPKDVVLYQYEACPFCNKVKGRVFLAHLLNSSQKKKRSFLSIPKEIAMAVVFP